MRIRILLIFLLISNLAISQNGNGIYSLKTIQPTDTSFTDLKQLDTFFQNKTIIGIGESTHGTSEFTTMRHRIFKYLVEYHDFNTFFLEADFGACQRINRYVHGENDTLLKVIRGINLWPWMTEEMKIFIEWMKEYNSENGNKLSFVGCDMQFINDDIEELKKLPFNNKITIGLLDSMLEPENYYYKKDSAFLNRNIQYWQMVQRLMDTTLLSGQENITFHLLKNGINQFYEDFFINSIYSNHRDSCMGTNMFLYTKLNPKTKGIYFAHNGHAQKWKNDRGKFGTWKTAGQFTFELMGEKYFCILQDFYEGKLLAFNLKDKKTAGIRIGFQK